MNSGTERQSGRNGNGKKLWLVDSVIRITEKCLDRPGALAVVIILITFFAILSVVMPLSWKYSSEYVALGMEREKNTLRLIELQQEVLIDYKDLLENQNEMLQNQGDMIYKQSRINDEMLVLMREIKLNENIAASKREDLHQKQIRIEELFSEAHQKMTGSIELRTKQHEDSMEILREILHAIKNENGRL
jgi:hypothetical protein